MSVFQGNMIHGNLFSTTKSKCLLHVKCCNRKMSSRTVTCFCFFLVAICTCPGTSKKGLCSRYELSGFQFDLQFNNFSIIDLRTPNEYNSFFLFIACFVLLLCFCLFVCFLFFFFLGGGCFA